MKRPPVFRPDAIMPETNPFFDLFDPNCSTTIWGASYDDLLKPHEALSALAAPVTNWEETLSHLQTNPIPTGADPRVARWLAGLFMVASAEWASGSENFGSLESRLALILNAANRFANRDAVILPNDTLVTSLDFSTIEEGLFHKKLLDLPPKEYLFGPVRDVLNHLRTSQNPRRVQRFVEQNILLCSSTGEGILGKLKLELVEKGRGEVYPCPIQMPPLRTDDAFRNAPHIALQAAVGQIAPIGPFVKLYDPTQFDFRWSIQGISEYLTEGSYQMQGASLGAAFAVGFTRLLTPANSFWEDERYVITAEIDAEGKLNAVGDVVPKTSVAFTERNSVGGYALSQILVHPHNSGDAETGISNANRKPIAAIAVDTASNLSDVFKKLKDFPEKWRNHTFTTRILHQDQVDKLVSEYLHGPPERQAMFAGREAEQKKLDDFINSTDQTCLLVTGKSGRGKSNLLVKWADLQRDHPTRKVVFSPVTRRYGITTPLAVMQTLVTRLEQCFNIPRSDKPESEPLTYWTNQLNQIFNSTPTVEQIILVVDGLDEMDFVHDRDNRLRFPFPNPDAVPSWLKIIVSARERPAEHNETPAQKQGRENYWLEWMQWTGGYKQVGKWDVGLLTRNEIAKLMSERQLPSIAPPEELVDIIYTLSDGFPLLVRLYLNLLIGREGKPAYTIDIFRKLIKQKGTTGANTDISEGLRFYFSSWLSNLLEDPSIKSNWEMQFFVMKVIGLLALAQGPLPETLWKQLAQAEKGTELFKFNKVKESLLYILESHANGGWSLSHLELGTFLQETPPQNFIFDWEDYRNAYLQAGDTTLNDLEGDKLQPKMVPEYWVRYLGKHVQQHPTLSPETKLGFFEKMMGEGWCKAWQKVEGLGQYSGYLNDVDVVRTLTHEIHTEQAKHEQPLKHLPQEIRAALIRSSICTLAERFPPRLLAVLVYAKLWTPVKALEYVERLTDVYVKPMTSTTNLSFDKPHKTLHQITVFVELARVLDQPELSRLAAIAQKNIRYNIYQCRVLSEIIARCSDKQEKQILINKALTIADGISEPHWKELALNDIDSHSKDGSAKQLVDRQRFFLIGDDLLSKIARLNKDTNKSLEIANIISSPNLKKQAISDINNKYNFGNEDILVANPINDLVCQCETFLDIASWCADSNQKKWFFDQAISLAGTIPNPSDKSQAVSSIAARCEDVSLKEILINQTIDLANSIPDGSLNHDIDGAIELANSSTNARRKNEALAQIVSKCEEINQARKIADSIDDPKIKSRTFAQIAARCEDVQEKRSLFDQAVQIGYSISDLESKSQTLVAIASYCEDVQQKQSLIEQAINFANSIPRTYTKYLTLSKIASACGQTNQALIIAGMIGEPRIKSELLVDIASRCEDIQQKQSLIDQAINFASEISDCESQWHVFAKIAYQSPKLLNNPNFWAWSAQHPNFFSYFHSFAIKQKRSWSYTYFWRVYLNQHQIGTRSNLLTNLPYPVIIALGGDEILPAIAEVVQEVCRRWP